MSTHGSTGFDSIERDEIRKIINSNLKMLLLTNPGELVSDSKFGVGLYSYLFLLETEPQIRNLKETIVEQINTYLSYLENYTVFIDSSKVAQHKLAVRIVYIITESLSRETVDFIVTEESTTTIVDESGGATTITLGDILSERV